jgi:predicted transcriptional regulator
VGQDAVVTAYVVAPLCVEAEQTLAKHEGNAGEVRVRVSCLPKGERGGKTDLAVIGEGARRATEDSTSIAYITTTDPVAIRYSETILEEAGIAQLPTSSGATAMAKLLHAVAEAGNASNLRESVDESLAHIRAIRAKAAALGPERT